MKRVAWLLAGCVVAGTAFAEDRTVTLSVQDMTCAACPITVKKALNGVDGVKKVSVSLETKEAIVTYDDAKTKVDALVDATTFAGYPSKAKP